MCSEVDAAKMGLEVCCDAWLHMWGLWTFESLTRIVGASSGSLAWFVEGQVGNGMEIHSC